jgi:sulfate adenylyltransferase
MIVPEHLIAPHGGRLVELISTPERRRELLGRAARWPSWDLSARQLCDLELMLGGGFSPLRGFLGRTDYESVCARMRLADGTLWPIPVTLDVPDAVGCRLGPGAKLVLRDPEGVPLAVLHVDDAWRPDREAEAQQVLGTFDEVHPGVAHLRRRTGSWYVGGVVEGLGRPRHYDFRDLRHTPAELRAELARRGWDRVVAFQTRNPMHRAHLELLVRAARATDASLLVHPVVGHTRPGDIDHYTRVRCYRAVMPSLPAGRTMLSLLPLAMRMAGPREAVWHAIIRKNHGADHFIVGRDHAGPGLDRTGRPFYDPYQAQDLLGRHQAELGIRILPFRQMVYVVDADAYLPEDEVPYGARTRVISGTRLRRQLDQGRPLPAWFTPAAVARELRRSRPSRAEQGVTIFLTGLPSAGKSTIANVLQVRILEGGGRGVTLLDGDLVRKHLSAGLGFSKEDREQNVHRIGFVAAQVTKHRGVAICAQIAPYDAPRKAVRAMVEAYGGFLLVHVATPVEVCEARDRKGLYARARAGMMPAFHRRLGPLRAARRRRHRRRHHALYLRGGGRVDPRAPPERGVSSRRRQPGALTAGDETMRRLSWCPDLDPAASLSQVRGPLHPLTATDHRIGGSGLNRSWQSLSGRWT